MEESHVGAAVFVLLWQEKLVYLLLSVEEKEVFTLKRYILTLCPSFRETTEKKTDP